MGDPAFIPNLSSSCLARVFSQDTDTFPVQIFKIRLTTSGACCSEPLPLHRLLHRRATTALTGEVPRQPGRLPTEPTHLQQDHAVSGPGRRSRPFATIGLAISTSLQSTHRVRPSAGWHSSWRGTARFRPRAAARSPVWRLPWPAVGPAANGRPAPACTCPVNCVPWGRNYNGHHNDRVHLKAFFSGVFSTFYLRISRFMSRLFEYII